MNKQLFTIPPLEPGAKDRIESRLKDLDKINKERPCYKCIFNHPKKLISCASPKKCNFYHDQFIEMG